MSTLLQDLRYALRQMHKSPTFSLGVVATLALGIGATVAIFSVVHAVLLKPLAYRDADRIVLLTKQITPVRFEEMQKASQSYEALGSYAGVMEQMALTGSGTPQVLNGARVSANFLQVLGVKPLMGRGFAAREEESGAPAVAMIGEGLWNQRFGRDPNICGKVINLAGVSHTIIGVLPAGFRFPFAGSDVWVTKSSELLNISPQSRLISPTLKVFGRLKPGVTTQEANAESAVLKRQYAAGHPGMLDGKLDSPEALLPLKQTLVSDVSPKLWMLFGAVTLALVIVCANAGNLMLVRAVSRTREFAVRAAIGAKQSRILQQLLVEGLLLAILAGSIGVALAVLTVGAVQRITIVDLPRSGEIHVDLTVLAFALGISTASGLLLALAPALITSRPNLAAFLQPNSNITLETISTRKWRFPARQFLVGVQIALSLSLLIGATLLAKSLLRLYRVDPGFQSDHLLTMHLALSSARYETPAKQALFYEQMVEHVKSLPSVRDAAVCLTLPFTGWAGVPVQLEKGPELKLNERPIGILEPVTPDYFSTMRIQMKRGRAFTTHDNENSVPVAIINERLAQHFWPAYPQGPDPIGQYLLMGRNPKPKEIVGIAGDVRAKGRDHDPSFSLYIPNAQLPIPEASLIVRTSGEPLQLASTVQKVIFALDPGQPVSDIKTMDDVADASEGELRLITRLLTGFASGTTLIALIGIYALLSYSVAQRTKEIGIRHALGAPRAHVFGLVLRQGFVLSVTGITFGAGAAFGITRILKGLLFQINPTDPSTFLEISVLFLVMSLIACYVPAWRALKIDPIIALRYE